MCVKTPLIFVVSKNGLMIFGSKLLGNVILVKKKFFFFKMPVLKKRDKIQL